MLDLKTAAKAAVPLRVKAAQTIIDYFITDRKLDRRQLSKIMTAVYGGKDSDNFWSWKDAYDAVECAELIYIKDNAALITAMDPQGVLTFLRQKDTLQPTQTVRSEGQQALQQYSTPLWLSYICHRAAQIKSTDIVLEPSAGHGALAVFPFLKNCSLLLNEIDRRRAETASFLFQTNVHSENAAHIHDLLPCATRPDIVIMNPPFSASITRGSDQGETGRHIISALHRLKPNGRLVAITGASFAPKTPSHAKSWDNIKALGTLVSTVEIGKQAFAKKGVSFPTRIHVIDKRVSDDKTLQFQTTDPNETLDIINSLPLRKETSSRPIAENTKNDAAPARPKPKKRTKPKGPLFTMTTRKGVPVEYDEITASSKVDSDGKMYVDYKPQRIRIKGACPHPSILTQSTGLAAIMPPMPTYQPYFPQGHVENGLLSDAQLEAIIYAGQAHSRMLRGNYVYDSDRHDIKLTSNDDEPSFQLRQGFCLSDQTGVGKGRIIAGIKLDNWIRGRRKAIWISKSAQLIEDARRDLMDLGFQAHELFGQSDFEYGSNITRTEGILFTTFALIRGEQKDERKSRLQQLLDWAGNEFEGVISFDESHALSGAVTTITDRGVQASTLQGMAGLEIQYRLPNARIVYSSATSAETVSNLGYMDRLGLWRGLDAPFENRSHFLQSIEDGGDSALELVARDLKAMGLYCARNISFEGVEYEPVIHELTDEQTAIYDEYAHAFTIIHNNLEAALESMQVKSDGTSINKNAVSAARSAFESTKQRFFNHLITSMKMPTLLKMIDQEIDAGLAPIVQISQTGEAILSRRLKTLDPRDVVDGNFDLTPRDNILDYLEGSFPTQLFEVYRDDSGNEQARPMFDDNGCAVQCQDALDRKHLLLEKLCALPPIPSALDQLIWHYGPDRVAELTGRTKRILKTKTLSGEKIRVQSRGARSNLNETNAFMDGKKDMAVFSEAGATGISLHASLKHNNQKRRAHFLLQGGWAAKVCIQGLGRSHRSNQAVPPIFRLVSTDVKGEKRFLSTISRRLNSLGAITKGERKTGGQNLLRPEDNLESVQAREALLIFFRRLHAEPQAGITLQKFQEMTGLKLTDKDGTLLETLPPIQRFLNRLLALPIHMQNRLFEVFEEIVDNRIEIARDAGTLDVGAETIRADKIEILSNTVLREDPINGAKTNLIHVRRFSKNTPLTFQQLSRYFADQHRLMINTRSKKVALICPTTPMTDAETGRVRQRVEIIRPNERTRIHVSLFEDMNYEPIDKPSFKLYWDAAVNDVDEYHIDEFGIVTGLTMPLWSILSETKQTVYRLQLPNEGEVLGRYIPPSIINPLRQKMNVASCASNISPEAILNAVKEGETFEISQDCSLGVSRVMDRNRIEIKGYKYTWLDGLKSLGCFTEIISYKTRLFIPDNENALPIIKHILSKYVTV